MRLIIMKIAIIVGVLLSVPTSAIEVFNCDTNECKKQFKQYKKFAKNGSPDAQEILANLYMSGYGVEKNLSLAAKWFKKASGQGQYGAKASLAFMYIQGQGKEQDVKRGIKMLESLADKKVNQAALQLGVLYAQGEHVKQDYIQAEKWLMNAISSGNQQAIMILALMYEYGLTGTYKLEDAKMLYQHLAGTNETAAERLAALENSTDEQQGAVSNIDIFNVSPQTEEIERIEVLNNIGVFLTDNLNFIKTQGIYTSSSTGSRLKGKRCTNNVNCKAAINTQDKFNIMNFWQGMRTIKFHVNKGGI